MPYANEHSCRLKDPSFFSEFFRKNRDRSHDGKYYDVVYGRRRSDGNLEEQAYRYPVSSWTAHEARSHCESHNGSFEPASSSRSAALAYLTSGIWAIDPSYYQQISHALHSGELSFEVDLPTYTQSLSTHRKTPLSVIIPLKGIITPKTTILNALFGGMGLDLFTQAIHQAGNDPDIQSIILDVDSPGGLTTGVYEAALAVWEARKKKKVYSVVDGIGASAAYWILSQSHEIIISKSSEIGSIGVFSLHLDNSKRMEQSGVVPTFIFAGKYKTEGNPLEPLTDEAREAIQSRVDYYYELFIADVARGRRTSISNVRDNYGQGRLLTSDDAIKLGMADSVGSITNLTHNPTLSPTNTATSDSYPIRSREWDTRYINDLPDSAFAIIEPGGTKDDGGKTTPRRLRHLPHHNSRVSDGNDHDTVDIPHLRNALARVNQVNVSPSLKNRGRSHLNNHARALGVGEAKESSMEDLITRLRSILNLDDESDLEEALTSLVEKSSKLESDLSSATAQLRALSDRVGALESDLAKREAASTVENALRSGKILPSMRDWAMSYALRDPEGFGVFLSAQPKQVEFKELGSQANNTDDLEPTEEEILIARKMGVSIDKLKLTKTALRSSSS